MVDRIRGPRYPSWDKPPTRLPWQINVVFALITGALVTVAVFVAARCLL